MNISKMYKLERLVKLYKNFHFSNSDYDLIKICSVSNFHLFSVEDLKYIERVIAIPYHEMLEYLEEYQSIDIGDEMDIIYFMEKISQKYNVDGSQAYERFKDVNKLSKSRFFSKKMSDLYITEIEINESAKKLKRNK